MSALLLLSPSQTINMAIIRTMIIHGLDHDYDEYDDFDEYDDYDAFDDDDVTPPLLNERRPQSAQPYPSES